MYFEEELRFLINNEGSIKENKRDEISDKQLKKIIKSYPLLPNDYINFLFEIGFGSLRNSLFKIYPDLCDFYDLGLENIYQMPSTIKLFGDDYSGNFAGFDISNSSDEVVEFWHESNEIYRTKKTFREYIRDKILMTPNY